jgi:hypothetical protein
MSGPPLTADFVTRFGDARERPQAVIALHGKSDHYSNHFVSSCVAPPSWGRHPKPFTEGDIVPCRKVIATSQTLSHLRLCKKETQRKRMAAIQIPLFPAAIDFDLSGLAKWIEGIV